jgi:AI-2 transport protein TqsA
MFAGARNQTGVRRLGRRKRAPLAGEPSMSQTGTGDMTGRRGRVLVGCVIAITVILLGWMLRATAVVMIPVVFSVFLALLVAPVDRWGRRHAPRRAAWLGHVAAMGVILLALLFCVASLWIAAQQLVDRLPEGAAGWSESIPLAGPAEPDETGGGTGAEAEVETQDEAGLFARLRTLFASAGDSFLGRVVEWAVGYASTILATAGTVLAGAVLVFFLTLLMLIEGPKWRKKLRALGASTPEGEVTDAVGEIAERLRKYLWTRTIIGALTALLYVGWLWVFGVDLLFVWGLLAFLLNYIPTVGALIAGLAPVAYAFLTRDFGTAALAGAGILVIEQVMGNYVDPRVQGRQVSISPLVVLIVLLFWGWIWGIAGAILAVPITIALVIVSSHVPPLRPLALILGDETEGRG